MNLKSFSELFILASFTLVLCVSKLLTRIFSFFFRLLFNFQGPFCASRFERSCSISHYPTFVNTFFQVFSYFFSLFKKCQKRPLPWSLCWLFCTNKSYLRQKGIHRSLARSPGRGNSHKMCPIRLHAPIIYNEALRRKLFQLLL